MNSVRCIIKNLFCLIACHFRKYRQEQKFIKVSLPIPVKKTSKPT